VYLVGRTAASLAGSLATGVGVVELYVVGDRFLRIALGHGGLELVVYEPGGDAQVVEPSNDGA